MKIMIATVTYPTDQANGRNDAVRETWRNDWVTRQSLPRDMGYYDWDAGSDFADVDQRFFYDYTHTNPQEDEIILHAPSGLSNTSLKTWRLCQWAAASDYDYLFVAPTDCYICVPRLVVSGFQVRDYTGYQVPEEGHIGGGSGYWLSRKAFKACSEFSPYPDYEDRWVGAACRAAGLEAFHDARYWSQEQKWLPGIITAHLSDEHTARYDPDWMRKIHEQYLEIGEIGRVS